MSAYADTGFLCSLYAPDGNTAQAVRRMETQSLPLTFTWLHELELRNALRLRVFRGQVSTRQRDVALNLVLSDLAAGVLAPVTPPLNESLVEAERLGAMHSETLGTRSLDILHVAFALSLGADVLLTFDSRQASLAKAAGLSVPPMAEVG